MLEKILSSLEFKSSFFKNNIKHINKRYIIIIDIFKLDISFSYIFIWSLHKPNKMNFNLKTPSQLVSNIFSPKAISRSKST